MLSTWLALLVQRASWTRQHLPRATCRVLAVGPAARSQVPGALLLWPFAPLRVQQANWTQQHSAL